ncbi:capsular polysaccharide biosynthesis protein Cps4B [Streptococcus mitis]|uniref:capsular polysaccharide biosynthesis protein Cps4B n=1 Tax=Streptococcus mitis TaxID=28037 RepID=UPI00066A4592|nr:capsular polysaccharide biosynthesis protein Cps4B [Streptococcus mitis]
MIDIHSHIVFGVDDGPRTREESLALLQEAFSQGVRTIVSTSHRRKNMFETPEEVIMENFKEIQALAQQELPDLTILYGAEIYYSEDALEKLESKQIPTLNDTQYALIEFSSRTPYWEIRNALSKILLLGIKPVIAHIERYAELESNEKRVKELIDMGCYTQINSSSVLKPRLFRDKYRLFKKRAQYFLSHNLVHCVASDMHNLTSRPPYMKQAFTLIKQQYGEKKAQELFMVNPQSIISNKII